MVANSWKELAEQPENLMERGSSSAGMTDENGLKYPRVTKYCAMITLDLAKSCFSDHLEPCDDLFAEQGITRMLP